MRIRYAVFLLALGLFDCTEQKKTVVAPAPKPLIQQPAAVLETKTNLANDFKPVAEMLGRNCAPCHIPGGKLYDRLPFDNPEIVTSHGSSIQKRIKAPEDAALLESWLAAH